MQELENMQKTADSIMNIYKELCELEILNQKNTPKYKKYMEYLKIALEVESAKYQSLTNEELKELQRAAKGKNERVFRQTDKYIEIDDEEITQTVYLADLQREKEKYIFYSMLEDEINENHNINHIALKYLLLFADTQIEPYAVENNFNMSHNNKVIIEQSVKEIPADEFAEYANIVKSNAIIEDLLSQETFDIAKEEDLIQILKLRTSLTQLSNEPIKSIQASLKEYAKIEVNHEALNKIKEVVTKTTEDKEKYKLKKLVIS